MLNNPQNRSTIYLAIAWLLIMELLSLFSYSEFTCIVNPNNYGSYYAASHECPPFHVFLTKGLAGIFEILGDPHWVTAIFTIVLAFSTVFLWWTTRNVANATRIAAEHIPKVERAYVFGGPAKINTENGITSLKINVDNSGRTPGIVKFICAEFGLELPPGPTPSYPNGKRILIDVAINSSGGLNPIDPANKVLLPSVYRTNVQHPHYFWGYIEYIDIFRHIHKSRFCVLIYPGSKEFELAGGEAWNEWD